MLLDSTVFIDFLRGYEPTVEAFQKSLYGQSTSVTTKLELIIGLNTKKDIKHIESILKNLHINVLPITEDISNFAEKILINYYHSRGIGILDALIAATAIVYDEELVTRNVKHFDFIPNLKIISPYK